MIDWRSYLSVGGLPGLGWISVDHVSTAPLTSEDLRRQESQSKLPPLSSAKIRYHGRSNSANREGVSASGVCFPEAEREENSSKPVWVFFRGRLVPQPAANRPAHKIRISRQPLLSAGARI